MLEVKNIYKIYQTGEVTLNALNNVSIAFRDSEFVSILGQSGSGKSTLLNIIGGLDNYSYGDLLIDGVSTVNYTSNDWDAYRNNKIGFVFQNYNLIMHQTVLANVTLSLTLSGISKKEREKRAIEALTKVGLKDQINKKPLQLSGGQMQRVAIARAIVNDPEIILADEPTGALDSETSIQIMEILKELSKDKLVIMVTHNPELAKKYSTRIVELKDGNVISDTKEFKPKNVISDNKKLKNKSMSFLTAISLSFNNLLTKKGRTILTSIAGGIGITCIALVLALSNGVNNYSNELQKEFSGSMPITVSDVTEVIDNNQTSFDFNLKKDNKSNKNIVIKDDVSNSVLLFTKTREKNINTGKLKKYLEENKDEYKDFINDVVYRYDVNPQFYTTINNNIEKVTIDDNLNDLTMILTNSFKEINTNKEVIENQYTLINGKLPENYNELVLVVDNNQALNLSTLYSLGILAKEELYSMLENNKVDEEVLKKEFNYDELINKEYRLIYNPDYFVKKGNSWIDMENDSSYINNLYKNALKLKVVGIVKAKTDSSNIESGFIGYTNLLTNKIINENNTKTIVKEQLKNKNINVLTGKKFDGIVSKYSDTIKKLGIADIDNPTTIELYGNTINDKTKIKEFLDKYNSNQEETDKVIYSDMMEELVSIAKTIVNVISIVLIAFVSISLVVSCLMIAIITYISVLERTKEIGILRAIGASKKDIRRVFNAETIVEGFLAGLLGVIVALLISLLANAIVGYFVKIDGLIKLPFGSSIFLILLSMFLTFIAGAIPSSMAAKKNPIEALKTE